VASFIPGLAVHELGHKTVFKTKWLNDFFLRIYATLGWHNFYEYAMSHTYHHMYTLHPQGDREVVLPREPSLKFTWLLQLFTFNIFGGLEANGCLPTLRATIRTAFGYYNREWIQAVFVKQPAARRQAVNWARWLLLFHGGILLFGIIFQLWWLPLLVSLPTFIGNWLKYFVGMPMHTGLRDNVPDFRLCVRTITLDPLSEFLYWHMNWHTEHHMFAATPCYNLKKLHRVVADDMPKPRTLFEAWREMRAIRRRQQQDPAYMYDTPLPKPAANTAVGQDPLAASLGELAPAALRRA
jgi:fatty acid desaturase